MGRDNGPDAVFESACRLAACLMMVLALASSQIHADQWIQYHDETKSRLIADSLLGVSDADEKAYAWGDFDRDGDIDLICVRKTEWASSTPKPNVLLMNEGVAEGHPINGVLVDRTAALASLATDTGQGFLDSTNDRSAILTDVNNDGWLDLVTAVTLGDGMPKRFSHPRIYLNLGASQGTWLGFIHEEPRFPHLLSAAGQTAAPRFGAVAGGDLSNDGFVDLFFVNDEAGPISTTDLNDRLLLNNGQGSFTDFRDFVVPPGVMESSRASSVVMADFNGDGFLDVAKSEASGLNAGVRISYNNPALPGVLDRSHLIYRGPALHLAMGDLDGNGRPDLALSDAGFDRYFLNLGLDTEGLATFNTRYFLSDSGVDQGPGGNVVIADLDGDGQDDVLIADADPEFAGCNRRLRIYRNLGRGIIAEQGEPSPWNLTGIHDAAVFDLNGDGRQDLILGTCHGTRIFMNGAPSPVRFLYPDGVPAYVIPGTGDEWTTEIAVDSPFSVLPGSPRLHVSSDGGPFVPQPLVPLTTSLFRGSLPALECGETLNWYVSVMLNDQREVTDPPEAPGVSYRSIAAVDHRVLFRDEFEGNINNWSVQTMNADFGAWERVIPVGTNLGGRQAAPSQDFTRGNAANKMFVTQNGVVGGDPTRRDLDGGPTYLISPAFDLQERDALVSVAVWVFCDDRGTPDEDFITIEVSSDDGGQWVPAQVVYDTDGDWQVVGFQVSDFVAPSSEVRIRLGIADTPNNSITEAALDDFQVMIWECAPALLAMESSFPPFGAIDARQPHELSNTLSQGWSEVEVAFNRSFGENPPLNWQVATGSGSPAIQVIGVQVISDHVVKVTLNVPIPPGLWTTLTALGVPGEIRVGYLPGDVNADSQVNPQDIVDLVSSLRALTPGRPPWSTDLDRSGLSTPLDLLRAIDLHNGAGAFEPWSGRELPL